jgi:hypothetical protein
MDRTQALQWIYTSSKKGQGGFAGFDVWAQTPGLGEDEQDELKKLSSYTILHNLPPQPTPEEMAALFPTIFRAGTLRSGKKYVLRSVYAGQDYSMRWGNFIAHALVFSEGRLEGYPIDLLAWEGWKKPLTAREDNGQIQAPLPVVETEALGAVKVKISLPEICLFLKSEHGRIEVFEKMLSAIFAAKSGGKRLLIRDKWETIYLWLASLQKVFPVDAVKNLSCCTFISRPENAADVSFTVPGSAFAIDDIALKRNFYIFDLSGGKKLQPELTIHPYAAKITQWLNEDGTKISAFLDFLDNFTFDLNEKTLLTAQNLFALAAGNNSEGGFKPAEIIEFFVEHAKTQAIPLFIKILSPQLASFEKNEVPVEALARLSRFIIKRAPLSGDENIATFLGKSWVIAFRAQLSENASTTDISMLRQEIRDNNQMADAVIKETLVSPENLENFTVNAKKINPGNSSSLGQYLVDAIAGLGQAQIWQSPMMLKLISGFSPEARKRFVSNIPSFENSVVFFVSKTNCPWGNVLADLFSRLPHETVSTIRSQLAVLNLNDALLGEFTALMEAAKDITRTYETYIGEITAQAPAFSEAYGPSLNNIYLEKLEPQQQLSQLRMWIKSDAFYQKLGDAYAGTWLKKFVGTLPLDSSETVESILINKINIQKETLNIVFKPDVFALRELNKLVCDNQRTEVFARVKNLSASIAGISETQYVAFLNLNLAKLLFLAKNAQEVQEVMELLILPGKEQIFYQKYFEFLARVLKRFTSVKNEQVRQNGQDMLFLDYWFTCPEEIFSKNCPKLGAVVSACDNEQLKFYRNEFSKKNPKRFKQLSQFMKKPGIIGSIIGSLFRK